MLHKLASVGPEFPPSAVNTVKTTELMTRVRSKAIKTATRIITVALVHWSPRVSQGRCTNCQVQLPTAKAMAAMGSASASEYVPRINAPQYQVDVPTKISNG